MNKAPKYALTGALTLGFINALYNASQQPSNRNSEEKFEWMDCIAAFCKGALVGGAVGFAIGYVRDDEMGNALSSIGGLGKVVENVLEEYSDTCTFLERKAEKIQRLLYAEFQEELNKYPTINGSAERDTAIVGSDIDIQLKLKKEAVFIDEMKPLIMDFLIGLKDRHLEKIRDQEYSIGLIFRYKGEVKRIDVVPTRAVYNDKDQVYIYSSVSKKIRKTNPVKQSQALRFTEKQRKIIKILKGWKKENNLKLPSVLIEHLVMRAFSELRISRGLSNSLLDVLEYIASRIKSIRIVDPANSNNIISNCLTLQEKKEISNFCFQMVDSIKRDERNILDYFKI